MHRSVPPHLAPKRGRLAADLGQGADHLHWSCRKGFVHVKPGARLQSAHGFRVTRRCDGRRGQTSSEGDRTSSRNLTLARKSCSQPVPPMPSQATGEALALPSQQAWKFRCSQDCPALLDCQGQCCGPSATCPRDPDLVQLQLPGSATLALVLRPYQKSQLRSALHLVAEQSAMGVSAGGWEVGRGRQDGLEAATSEMAVLVVRW
mmetsp:Transcript_37684/g.87136  ORF Transcript_37684/g.87136 Transcript_37684/m.87136 type:complete len:205 (-) Transcript_37684:1203-1817(-)